MADAKCEVNPEFVSRVVTGKQLMPLAVAQAMQEVMEEIFLPEMRDNAPWLPDGTYGPEGEDPSWVVTGHSRASLISFVPFYIPPAFQSWDEVDEFGHRHFSDPQALLDKAAEAGGGLNPQLVTLVVGRYANNTKYLQAMEKSHLGGFGNPPPVNAWDPPGITIEDSVFGQNKALFWTLVRARLQEKMMMITGARGGMIW